MTATAIESQATWSDYLAAIGSVSSSLGELAAAGVNASISGPYVPLLVAVAIMKYRADGNGVIAQIQRDAGTVKTAAGNTASRIISAARDVTAAQIEEFKTAYAEQTSVNALEDLRKLADLMVMDEPTMQLTSMTSAPLGSDLPPTERVTGRPEPGEPIRRMTGKRKATVSIENLEADERSGAPRVAKLEEGSDVKTTSPGTGGRRRKTRKGKKVRRVTRRMRRFTY
jgi:hypothetical protein